MILVGIDDTDTLDARGTNQLARALADRLAPQWRCELILRHQLLVDPRIPYTSHNGSASLHFVPLVADATAERLAAEVRAGMLADFIEGSDPGLCVAHEVPGAVRAFGDRCRRDVVTQDEARALAVEHGIHLEGLGGSQGGVIGALAAVGLGAGGDYGRVIRNARHGDLVGEHTALEILGCGVDEIRAVGGAAAVTSGVVDVGKHLRPNRRANRTVLFVEPAGDGAWRAVRCD
jgi:hypothetical protein